MMNNTVFLRTECILPEDIQLRQEELSADWKAVIGTLVTDLDNRIRRAGWHFMWMLNSHSSRCFGGTEDAAIHRALVHALRKVQLRFNAAELDDVQVTKYPYFRMAKVTLHARQIQKKALSDWLEEINLR